MEEFVIKDGILVRYQGWSGCVKVPEGVNVIGVGAFENHLRVKSVTLPASVIRIGERAFRGCKSLEYVRLPDGLEIIDDEVFCNCIKLKEITFPDSLVKIGAQAFRHCNSLTSVTIPDGITEINDGTFAWCRNLKTAFLPKTLNKICYAAFANCGLKNINIPYGVNTIVSCAFRDTIRLRKINFPGSIKSLGNHLVTTFGHMNCITTDVPLTYKQVPANIDGCRIVTSRISYVPDKWRANAVVTFVKELSEKSEGESGLSTAPGEKAARRRSHDEYIRRHSGELIEQAFDNPELLTYMCEHKYLAAQYVGDYIDRARARNEIETIANLMDYQLNVLGVDGDSFDDGLRNGLGIE